MKNLSRAACRSACVLVAASICATTVYAMRVSPMVVEMSSVGTGAVARIEVQNLNPGQLPFETRITKIDFQPDGTVKETPADQNFIVFPPQGILPQGARQVVRLQWVGAADLPASEAYYLSVNQLPVAVDGSAQGAQVQVVYHMKALVVVAPPGAQPNVSTVYVKPQDYPMPAAKPGDPPPAKVQGIEIELKNTGRRHAMMSSLRWILDGTGLDGKPLRIILSPDDLNRYAGAGYLAGGGATRVFRLPLVKGFGPGPIQVKFLK
nr:fimbria/pilus periplasmic chaperone [Sphingomonas naasensis]